MPGQIHSHTRCGAGGAGLGGGGLPRGEQRGCAPLSPQPYVQLEPNATPQLRETRAHPGCPVESTRTPGMGRRKPLGWVVGSLGVSKGVPPPHPYVQLEKFGTKRDASAQRTNFGPPRAQDQ